MTVFCRSITVSALTYQGNHMGLPLHWGIRYKGRFTNRPYNDNVMNSNELTINATQEILRRKSIFGSSGKCVGTIGVSDDREKSFGAPEAQISPQQPKFEPLPKRFFSPSYTKDLFYRDHLCINRMNRKLSSTSLTTTHLVAIIGRD